MKVAHRTEWKGGRCVGRSPEQPLIPPSPLWVWTLPPDICFATLSHRLGDFWLFSSSWVSGLQISLPKRKHYRLVVLTPQVSGPWQSWMISLRIHISGLCTGSWLLHSPNLKSSMLSFHALPAFNYNSFSIVYEMWQNWGVSYYSEAVCWLKDNHNKEGSVKDNDLVSSFFF